MIVEEIGVEPLVVQESSRRDIQLLVSPHLEIHDPKKKKIENEQEEQGRGNFIENPDRFSFNRVLSLRRNAYWIGHEKLRTKIGEV